MLSLRLAVLSVAIVAAAGGAAQTAPAQTLSSADLAITRSAVAATHAGDWSRAYAEAGAIGDPLPLKILHWLDYASPGAPARFVDIADFIEKNPDWPLQEALRKHAEEALSGESDEIAADWFKSHPPISAAGKARAAEILLNRVTLPAARRRCARPGSTAISMRSTGATFSLVMVP